MTKLDLYNKLDPKICALLVIDIQIDFCSKHGLLGKRGRDLSLIDPMIDKLEKTIALAGKAGILTLYTQQKYDRVHLNDLQKEQYDLDGKLPTCDIATDGYKFYRINPPEESVFVKYNYNAFSNPELEKVLNKHKIKTLVIAGVDSDCCVETAVRNAFDLGYKIVVPSDLVATNGRRIELQKRSLHLVERTYGVVIASSDLEKNWKTWVSP